MIVSDMNTALRRYGFDDTDPALSWLNAGMHRFETEEDWPFLFTDGSTTVVAGSTSITLPSDYSKPVLIKDMTHQTKLRHKRFRQFSKLIGDESETGKPIFYVVEAGVLKLWPVPDVDIEMKFIYSKSLPDMSNPLAECPLPTAWHWTVIKGAASIALQSENEEERAKTVMGEYQDDVDRARKYYHLDDLDEFETVVDDQEYSNG